MAELEYGNRDNLFNMMKAFGMDGGLLDMSQNLAETLDMIRDFPAYPASSNLAHEGVRFVTLPTGQVVSVGGGWTAGFADLQPYTEGMMEVHSRYQVPMTALDKIDNKGEYVAMQEGAHEEGLIQGWGNTILAGDDTTAPEKITGLMNRAPWNDVSQTNYVWDVGGSSNLRSAWLMKPGIDTVYSLYNPNHPTLGIEQKEMPVTKETGLGTSADEHRWNINFENRIVKGLCIKDQTAVKRLCNIPVGSSDYPGEDVVRAAIKMTIINATKRPGMGQALGTAEPDMLGTWMLYCDEQVYAHLVLAGNDKQFVYTSADNIYRTSLPMIGPNIIVRRQDALNKVSGSGETVIASA